MPVVRKTRRPAPRTPRKPVCACDVGSVAGADGPVRKALGVEPDLKASNITRLKRAEGQVRGIARMVEEDRYCPEIMIQIAAAQESLRAVAKNLLKNHLKHCARSAIKAGADEADAMCDELMDVMSRLAR